MINYLGSAIGKLRNRPISAKPTRRAKKSPFPASKPTSIVSIRVARRRDCLDSTEAGAGAWSKRRAADLGSGQRTNLLTTQTPRKKQAVQSAATSRVGTRPAAPACAASPRPPARTSPAAASSSSRIRRSNECEIAISLCALACLLQRTGCLALSLLRGLGPYSPPPAASFFFSFLPLLQSTIPLSYLKWFHRFFSMVFAFGNNMWLDFSDKVFNAMVIAFLVLQVLDNIGARMVMPLITCMYA